MVFLFSVSGAHRLLLGGALLIQGEEAGEDFVAEFIEPSVAPGLLFPVRLAVVIFFFFVIQDERAGRFEIGTSVRIEHGTIHCIVQLAQL